MRIDGMSVMTFLLGAVSAVSAQISEAVHPGYSVVNLRPPGFEPAGIGGMDFMADGTLAICTWGGFSRSEGEVLLLSGVTGPGAASVQIRKIARGLDEPMGLKVVAGEIYVMQRTSLSRFAVPSGTGLATPVQAFGGWHPPFNDWTYGLIYRDGSFYGTQGGWNPGDPNLSGNQNTWLKFTPGSGYQSLAGGLRNANGIGLGPEGEMFATDNQGSWLPSSKLIHLVPGRFYGCKNNPRDPFSKAVVAPPAVWIPHGDIGFSPSEPILIPSGIYKGQMLAGDVHFGGIQRYFLEKVRSASGGSEYQGAVFRFTGGLECGVNRLLFDKNGSLYMGGVGGSAELGDLGGWNWNNKWSGLQKLVPNGQIPFDMLAVRSLEDGFEIEFTQPIQGDVTGGVPGAGGLAAATFTAEQWRYQPTADYGGPKVDQAKLLIASSALSADGKRIRLKINGLKTGFVIHLKVSGLKSIAGEALWATNAWYTLNSLGPAEPTVSLQKEANPGGGFDRETVKITDAGKGAVRFVISGSGPFILSIHDASGRPAARIAGGAPGSYLWRVPHAPRSCYMYRLSRSGDRTLRGRFMAL